jgi:hypothetical protein
MLAKHSPNPNSSIILASEKKYIIVLYFHFYPSNYPEYICFISLFSFSYADQVSITWITTILITEN